MFAACMAFAGLGLLPAPAQAQDVNDLAERTAARVVQANPQRILIIKKTGCLAEVAKCTELNDSLGAELKKALPGVKLISQEDFAVMVKQHGFLTLDAYNDAVVKLIAPETGAQIAVDETVAFVAGRAQLETEIMDVAKLEWLQIYDSDLPGVSSADQEPFLYRDPETGVALIVPRGKPAGPKGIKPPICNYCPSPYPAQAQALGLRAVVKLLLTVNAKGIPENVNILDSPSKIFTDAAVTAVAGWRFKSPTDEDGKHVSVRIPMEANYDPRLSSGTDGGNTGGGGGRGRGGR